MDEFWHWLGKTNPNVVLPIIGLPVMWVINKLRGDNKSLWGSTINKVIDNLTAELLDEYVPSEGDVKTYLQLARTRIEKKVWEVLTKRGVPRNKWTEAVLHEAIERGTAWLGNELARLRLPYQLDELYKRLSETQAKLSTVVTPNSGSASP